MNEIDDFLNDVPIIKDEPIIIDDEIRNRLWKLSDFEYENLKQSIIKEGCREPIILWNNTIVDGHNRYEICRNFDITFFTTQKTFKSKNEVLEWVDKNQLSRRNLTDTQRTILEGRISKTYKQDRFSHPSVGQNVSRSQETVAKDLGKTPKTLQRAEKFVDAYDIIENNVGKEIADKIANEEIKVTHNDLILISQLQPEEQIEILTKKEEKPKLKLAGIKKEIKKEKSAEEGKTIILKSDLIDIRLGDFSEVLDDIPDNSIDLILTDPPYPYEFIECWTELGIFAEKKLKDGGFLIAYSGHVYLPEVMNKVLKSGLKWYWIGACLHTGAGIAQNFEVNMFAKFKPILFFYKGKKHKQPNWIHDVFESDNSETKDYHTWGQTPDIFDKLIKAFEPTIVVDPFLGGGTTAIACLQNNVKCIGAEIDETSYNISKKRIDEYEQL